MLIVQIKNVDDSEMGSLFTAKNYKDVIKKMAKDLRHSFNLNERGYANLSDVEVIQKFFRSQVYRGHPTWWWEITDEGGSKSQHMFDIGGPDENNINYVPVDPSDKVKFAEASKPRDLVLDIGLGQQIRFKRNPEH